MDVLLERSPGAGESTIIRCLTASLTCHCPLPQGRWFVLDVCSCSCRARQPFLYSSGSTRGLAQSVSKAVRSFRSSTRGRLSRSWLANVRFYSRLHDSGNVFQYYNSTNAISYLTVRKIELNYG